MVVQNDPSYWCVVMTDSHFDNIQSQSCNQFLLTVFNGWYQIEDVYARS